MARSELSQAEIERLRDLATRLRRVRRQSEHLFLGLPLYAIAIGPDLAKGELRGHAKGVIAVGGVALGHYAAGGIAYGSYVLDALQRSPEAIDLFSPWGFLDGFGPTMPNRR
jgi:hypothetical protein